MDYGYRAEIRTANGQTTSSQIEQYIVSTNPHVLSSTKTNTQQHYCTTVQPQERDTMEGVSQLPPHQQQQFMKHLEQMQMKDSLK